MTGPSDHSRQFLRHVLATVAYRGGKVLRGAPASFATFRACDSSRTPVEILAHLGDLYDWSTRTARGDGSWHRSEPLAWAREAERFFGALKDFDDVLASPAPLQTPLERLFQGPVADSLTHIGQIAMLRRLAGCPIKGENYVAAEITPGRVGEEQSPPAYEFD